MFGNLVSELMGGIKDFGGYLKTYTKPQDVIVEALAKGEFYLPAV